ncbi:MAG: twin-arginine translocase TatA/TatE family subunit [Deltaproteobacteria bacterium]|nr:MAG: twin-arginine translocase TatA/TatE family subunit [Deltaproteobacteria bacterium]
MFGLGSGELLVVAIIALIFIGPEKLPGFATTIGKFVRQLKNAVDEIKTDLKD